jgi:hypothetical protein
MWENILIFKHDTFFFLVTRGVRVSLRAPQLISEFTEHTASSVDRLNTIRVIDMHTEARTQVPLPLGHKCILILAVYKGNFANSM